GHDRPGTASCGQIRMPLPSDVPEREVVAGADELDEVPQVVGEAVRAAPADSDVDVLALPHDPGIPVQVAAEIQFGCTRQPRSGRGADPELGFLRHHRLYLIAAASYVARNGTEVSAGPDDHRGLELAVDHPCAVDALETFDRRPVAYRDAGAAKEELIELAPANRVAHHTAVVGLEQRPVQQACTKGS